MMQRIRVLTVAEMEQKYNCVEGDEITFYRPNGSIDTFITKMWGFCGNVYDVDGRMCRHNGYGEYRIYGFTFARDMVIPAASKYATGG